MKIMKDSANQVVMVCPIDQEEHAKVCVYADCLVMGYVSSGTTPSGEPADIGCVLYHFGENRSVAEALALAGIDLYPGD